MLHSTDSIGNKYTIIIEKDEEGWLVSDVIGLQGCHTQAKTMDELITRTKETISAYVKDPDNVDNTDRFVGVQQIEV